MLTKVIYYILIFKAFINHTVTYQAFYRYQDQQAELLKQAQLTVM